MVKTIKLFAYLQESIGKEVSVCLSDPVSRQDILNTLIEQFPLLKNELVTCNVAINHAFVTNESFKLQEIDEIALIPPVSGG